MLAAPILALGHIDIHVSGALTAGDVLVGIGTLLLAFFTWRLAVFTSSLATQTYALDHRTVARERQRRERQVRGIARLVDGELSEVMGSIDNAMEAGSWRFFYATPRGAWDRDGALIAEAVAEDEAFDLIRAYSRLTAWQGIVANARELSGGDADGIPLESVENALGYLLADINQARRHLKSLAYPDARDLEPDPDNLPPTPKRRRLLPKLRRPAR